MNKGNRIRKRLFMIITGISILSLLLSGCGGGTTPENEGTTAQEVSPAAQEEEEEVITVPEEEETEVSGEKEELEEEEEASEEKDEPVVEKTEEAEEQNEPEQLPEGIIRLFYYAHVMIPNTDPAAISGTHVIHSAVSTDGINFIEEAGDRFSYDTGFEFGITDPDVIRLQDGKWLMFVSLGQSLIKATSSSCGGPYVRDTSFQWDNGGVPGSGNFNGTIRTFVTRGNQIDAAEYNPATGKLTSAGTALSVQYGSVGSPSIMEINGTYYMVYRYADTTSNDPREHKIYIAKSTDGLTWTKHEDNRFICNGSVPGAVYCNGTIYIYGARLPETGSAGGDMGVAISRDGGATFTVKAAVIENKALSGAVDPCPVFSDE